MRVSELRALEPGRSLTIVNKAHLGARSLFGEVWVSNVIRPTTEDVCGWWPRSSSATHAGLLAWLMPAFLLGGAWS